MNMIKEKLTAWYDAHIVAAWYKSLSLIVGWVTSAVIFSPELLQFAADHWDIVGGLVLPKMDPQTKVLVLGAYVTFVAPALRAWQQKAMQQATIKQQAKLGKVIPLAASGVTAATISADIPPAAPLAPSTSVGEAGTSDPGKT